MIDQKQTFRCIDCKFWGGFYGGIQTSDEPGHSRYVGFECRECICEQIEYGGPYKNPGAGVHDVEGYGGRFVTSANFGCIFFEPKP